MDREVLSNLRPSRTIFTALLNPVQDNALKKSSCKIRSEFRKALNKTNFLEKKETAPETISQILEDETENEIETKSNEKAPLLSKSVLKPDMKSDNHVIKNNHVTYADEKKDCELKARVAATKLNNAAIANRNSQTSVAPEPPIYANKPVCNSNGTACNSSMRNSLNYSVVYSIDHETAL